MTEQQQVQGTRAPFLTKLLLLLLLLRQAHKRPQLLVLPKLLRHLHFHYGAELTSQHR